MSSLPPLEGRNIYSTMIQQPDIESITRPAIANAHLAGIICRSISASDGRVEDQTVVEARTDLDSHANMCVFGKNAIIIANTGQSANVDGFSPDVGTLHKVPIVDAAIAYDCPFTLKTYILVAKNVLHVPSMDINLIPPFVMREAGIVVNEVAKIHSKVPTAEDHSIYFEAQDLRIPLSL